MQNKQKYLGYKEEDFLMPFAKFLNENIARTPLFVIQGLKNKNNSKASFLPLENATDLAKNGYLDLENGYVFHDDGSFLVAVQTEMPNVTPEMWDWWFGWHGCHDNRYKLWHPKAHVSAVWQDGKVDERYIDRTSIIEEYIGEKLEKAAIQFKNPAEFGFLPSQYADKDKVVYICARIGYTNFPLDFGYLIHQVRATKNGSEMRSRFWLGGKNIAFRGDTIIGNFASKIIQKLKKLPEQQAIDLMIHCSEEMNHLASFLPELHKEFK